MIRAEDETQAAHPNPLPGTRPPGAHDEREASLQVREMFGRIAPRYDFLNHLLSASFDKLWRKRVARRFSTVLRNPDACVLDLCCGTGDLVFAFSREGRKSAASAQFIGADFALPMLALAQKKNSNARRKISFLAADALALPFPDASFDLISAAFGFRNLANYQHGLCEMLRLLRPGGALAILEFCEPQRGLLAAAFRFYFTRILPLLGGVISGNRNAYSYLPGSVEKFPPPEILKEWILQAGFREVSYERWTFGAVALHTVLR